MTNAQIQIRGQKIEESKARETARSNRANESETRRSNKAREKENTRSNKAKETQGYVKIGADTLTSLASTTGKAKSDLLKTLLPLLNDPKFYVEGNEEAIKAAVPTNFFQPNSFGPDVAASKGSIVKDSATQGIPNLMVLYYQNTIGPGTNSAKDIPYRAANLIFTKIQEETNYSKTYQPVDVLMMILAQREIITTIYHVSKLLRMAPNASLQNTLIPRALIKTLGVDYDDLVANYSDYVKRLTLATYRLGQLRIPNINLMHRARQMALGWYTDSPTDNFAHTQMYTFAPFSTGSYEINSDTSVGEIVYELVDYAYYDNKVKVSQFLDRLDSQIEKILSDTNFKWISGDLGRITDDFFTVSLDLDIPLVPVYDVYTLDQIKNVTVPMFGVNFNYNSAKVSQDPNGSGRIICEPYWTTGSATVIAAWKDGGNWIHLSEDNEISPDAIIDASRLIVTNATAVTETNRLYVKEFGTEIITRISVCTPSTYSPSGFVTDLLQNEAFSSGDDVPAVVNSLAVAFRVTRPFTHAPAFFVSGVDPDFQDINSHYIADYDKSRYFASNDFKYMNEAALYGLLGINTVFKI